MREIIVTRPYDRTLTVSQRQEGQRSGCQESLPGRVRVSIFRVDVGDDIFVTNSERLGEGIDNHCGPALVLDGRGRLHTVIGAQTRARGL